MTAGDFLLEVELSYRPEASGQTPVKAGLGRYIGSGDGVARGPHFAGTVHWDLFENQGPHVCDATFRGRIETSEGVTIGFHCLGFFRRPKGEDARWPMVGAVAFEASGARYEWLTAATAIWLGEFDASSHTHRYRVFRVENLQEPNTVARD